jgi:tryptophan halogenase
MSIPESLRDKMELFQSSGRLYDEADGLFAQGSWVQVMQGQGLRPRGYDPIIDVVDVDSINSFFEGIRQAVRNSVDSMPTHEEFIRYNCKSKDSLV